MLTRIFAPKDILVFLSPLFLPKGTKIEMYFSLFVISRCAVLCLDLALRVLVQDTTGPNEAEKRRTHALARKDCCFIATNQFVETFFLQRAIAMAFALYDYETRLYFFNFPYILYSLILAGLLLFVDDLLYSIFHAFLHHNKFLYRNVHMHHQTTSILRGYLDAVNEHPCEMAGALLSITHSFSYAAFPTASPSPSFFAKQFVRS